MGKSLANIQIKFGADLKQFSSQMQNANRQLKKHGKQMQKVGKSFSTYVSAPMVAFAAVSVKLWDKQAKAIAQVEAGLKSTGEQAGYTSEQLQKMATDLQDKTIFGDEEILKEATAQLLTFTNIAGVQFARTQQAALDLATRLGGDLKSASIQLGKALNDPVANLSALSRSGIQFSKEQKAVINSLVATNRLADAQTIILDELEKQYGGSAEAAAKAGAGGIQQLGNMVGDLSEDFGKLITEALEPFIKKLKGVVIALRELPPETKKTIAIIGGIVAAVGPLLVALGFLMTNVIPGLITAFGFLSGAMSGLWTLMLANPITATITALVLLGTAFFNLSQSIFENVGVMQTFWNMLKSGGNFNAFLNLQSISNAEALKSQAEAAKLAAGLIEKYSIAIDNAAESTKKLTDAATGTGKSNVQSIRPFASDRNIDTRGTNGLNNTSAGFEETVSPLAILPPTEDEIKAIEDYYDRVIAKQELLAMASQEVSNAVANAFADMANSWIDSLGIADNAMGNFVKSLGKSIIQLIARLLAQSIATAISGAQSTAAATGPGYMFTAPAMMATSMAGVVGAFGSVPKFADGGIVSGTTLGIMGEYAGASSNPEVIAPLDKLKDLLKNNDNTPKEILIKVIGKVDGRDIKLSLDRTEKQMYRLT